MRRYGRRVHTSGLAPITWGCCPPPKRLDPRIQPLSIIARVGSAHLPDGHLSRARWASLYARWLCLGSELLRTPSTRSSPECSIAPVQLDPPELDPPAKTGSFVRVSRLQTFVCATRGRTA